jgi:hypothetical protein
MSEVLIASNEVVTGLPIQWDGSVFKLFSGNGYKATRAEIFVFNSLMNGDWAGFLELCTVSNGEPDTVLASVSLDGPQDGLDEWFSGIFTNGGVVLQSGVQYALRFTCTYVNG